MNIQTIQMDPRIARIHFADYRKAVKRHREAREAERQKRAHDIHQQLYRVRVEKTQMEKEDEMLLGVYKALMKGERVLDVHYTIGKAGLDPVMRLPKLAIAPAHGKKCWIAHASGSVIDFRIQERGYLCKLADRVTVDFGPNADGLGTFHSQLSNYSWRRDNKFPSLSDVSALVPTIPPELRPDNLADYHILWEAEWKKQAPVDPVLLKRINARYYVVVAQWDLTPLERSVLEGRL